MKTYHTELSKSKNTVLFASIFIVLLYIYSFLWGGSKFLNFLFRFLDSYKQKSG